jgi:ribose/xylose/arabinose/galactoside ABC-type transport system permease subunit
MLALKQNLMQQRIWVLCLLVFLIMPLFKPAFLSQTNLEGILTSMIPYGIAALGLTIALITAEIDISIGSVIAFSSVTFSTFVNKFDMITAILLALLLSSIIGMINGYLVAYKRLSSFLVTVAMMISVRGIALMVSDQKPVLITNESFISIGALKIGPVPLLFFFFLIFVLLADLFLKKTQLGRNFFASGSNRDIAEASGLNVSLHKFLALTISAFLAGLGGILLTTRMNSGTPSVGEDTLLLILPMIVIGGTSISGGKGGAIKTLSGVLLLTLLFNVMSMFNIYVNAQNLIKGVILLAIIIMGKYILNKDKKV